MVVVMRERGRWRQGLWHVHNTLVPVMVVVMMKMMVVVMKPTVMTATTVGERTRRGVTLLFLILLLLLTRSFSCRSTADSVFARQVSINWRSSRASTRGLRVFGGVADAAAGAGVGGR